MNDQIEMPALGTEGDACSACRAPLAVDQRYCLQCGHRRGASRVDFAELLPLGEEGSPSGAVAAPERPQGSWTPLAVVGSIATLGVMLLLGVMLGRDDSPTQVTAAAPAAAPAVASTDAPAGANGTDVSNGPSKAPGSKKDGKTGDKGRTTGDRTAPASDAPGAQDLDQGDLKALEGKTGQDAADASRDLPDTIALPGEPPPKDNEAPGGGSDAQVIK